MYLTILLAPIFNLLFNLIFAVKFNSKINIINLLLTSLITIFFAFIMLHEVIYSNSFCLILLKTWFKIGILNVEWSLFFDKLSVILLILIIFISFLVTLFALDYLNDDPHLIRFLMLLSLFTIFMEILVTSGSLIQFFLGWEGVGLLSYLLINFWFTRYHASNSGLMAIIYNRIGDSGLLLSIALILFILETTDFLPLFLTTKFLCQIQIQFFYTHFYALDLLIFFLFLGVIGKSAQIFLESWLASAMEGPTPVSSLLHASTMIVSGVFLLQRFQPYLFYSFNGMILVTLVGSLTAFFAGTIGLVAMDLKRIIAYSTCSQMGYLVFCIGLGNTNVSLFHLFNHAFFKCLLFVAAGSLIHALINEQDIRLMGGLFKLFPLIFILITFASLSLMGFPFLSGYYSKEKILEFSSYIYNEFNLIALFFGSFGAFLTALYSMRLIFYVFFLIPNNYKYYYQNINNSIRSYLVVVLLILGTATIFSGYLFNDLIIGNGTDWNFFTINKLKIYYIDLHFGLLHFNFLTFYYTILGIFISFIYFYNLKKFNNLFLKLYQQTTIELNFFKYFYIFFAKRWYINLMYNRYIAYPLFFLGYNYTFLLLDKGFFENIYLSFVQQIISISKLSFFYFYKNFYFGELLLYLFLNYFYLMIFTINFLTFAVPKKKKKKKKSKKKKKKKFIL